MSGSVSTEVEGRDGKFYRTDRNGRGLWEYCPPPGDCTWRQIRGDSQFQLLPRSDGDMKRALKDRLEALGVDQRHEKTAEDEAEDAEWEATMQEREAQRGY